MPRTARIVVPGIPHHVTQRGNNRQTVFFVDDDYRAYVRILAEHTKKHGVEIFGYCLMTNHGQKRKTKRRKKRKASQ